MIKVYAISLVAGIVGLLIAILGGALAENLDRPDLDPNERFGVMGKVAVGALVGFGMGGMSAEFSPLDLTWPVSLLIALLAAGLAVVWVRYATTAQAEA